LKNLVTKQLHFQVLLKGVPVFLQKRIHFLQYCFFLLLGLLLGKLAYEQLYRSAILMDAVPTDWNWFSFWPF